MTVAARTLFWDYGHLHSKRNKGTRRGWEVRFVVPHTRDASVHAQVVLQESGCKPGKPWRNRRHWVIPVYGKTAYMAFKAVGR